MSKGKSEKSGKKGTKPKGEVLINKEWCKGCGFCAEFCPRGVLVMAEEFNSKGYHPPLVEQPERCTACDLCSMYCPEFAIWVEKLSA